MTDSWLKEVQGLRDKAWAEVKASPAFVSFKALDVAVGTMGGRSILGEKAATFVQAQPNREKRPEVTVRRRKRPSQGDVADMCLKQAGEPLPIRVLMTMVVQRGVSISGDDPLSNFRSTLSRDDRFKSIMREGAYFWWLTSSPVPIAWKEAEGPDLLDQPSASDFSIQKGGDGHAANNT